jgi:hypothetical protein
LRLQQNINDPIAFKNGLLETIGLSAFDFKRPSFALKVYGILVLKDLVILFFGAIILKCPALVS